ncbi:LuxR C-terminal-related transcriptional regulator, partial [Streptomyces sp. NPDC006134]|uniref:response regulator transcription factor n=1 Tax=Streptomyces sp. NPDC006134 TaxID=3154467 RepID=UPI003402E2C4
LRPLRPGLRMFLLRSGPRVFPLGPRGGYGRRVSNQAVGDRLHLTEGTIKSHLARIYAKLGVDSRTAAVATATGLGLIRR